MLAENPIPVPDQKPSVWEEHFPKGEKNIATDHMAGGDFFFRRVWFLFRVPPYLTIP